jgi:hypothetical protein
MIINFTTWLSLALGLLSLGITPLLLFKIVGNSVIFEKNFSKIIALVVSITIHFLFSFFVFFLALFFYVGPDPRPNQVFSVGSKIAIIILFLVYVLIEWSICSALVKKPITPFFLVSNNESLLSINDEN